MSRPKRRESRWSTATLDRHSWNVSKVGRTKVRSLPSSSSSSGRRRKEALSQWRAGVKFRIGVCAVFEQWGFDIVCVIILNHRQGFIFKLFQVILVVVILSIHLKRVISSQHRCCHQRPLKQQPQKHGKAQGFDGHHGPHENRKPLGLPSSVSPLNPIIRLSVKTNNANACTLADTVALRLPSLFVAIVLLVTKDKGQRTPFD
jgi:hypothetical protein